MKVKSSLQFFLLLLAGVIPAAAQNNSTLPPWTPGTLDIHHINGGTIGDINFMVLPDGSTMLVDMGQQISSYEDERRAFTVPDSSRTPVEWVADYIRQFAPKEDKITIDQVLLTHYDTDHMGALERATRFHPEGNYPLMGITELASLIPVKKLVDRGTSDPVDLRNRQAMEAAGLSANFIKRLEGYHLFTDYQVRHHQLVREAFEVGSDRQFGVNDPTAYPDFKIQNLFANGRIKNTWDNEVGIERYQDEGYPGENSMSAGIRISYGRFDYYTGGDVHGINSFGESDFMSMEALIGPVIGPVDVATLNHHGNRDSHNLYYVRNLRPKVWIGQFSGASHLGEDVYRRISFQSVYPGERHLFVTFRHPVNQRMVSRRNRKEIFTGEPGHIVVRVHEGGATYEVFVLDSTDPGRPVIDRYSFNSR